MSRTTPQIQLGRRLPIGVTLLALLLSAGCSNDPLQLSTGPTATVVDLPAPTIGAPPTGPSSTVRSATTLPTSPATLDKITPETVAVVTPEGAVELIDQVTLARKTLYAPTSPGEQAGSASIDRLSGSGAGVFFSRRTVDGCPITTKSGEDGQAGSALKLQGGGPFAVAESLFYTEIKPWGVRGCRPTALIRRNLSSGIEQRWELTDADREIYSGLGVQSVSADDRHVALMLSTPESGPQVAVLDVEATGPLLRAARLVPQPAANERLSVPHFAGGRLYAGASTWDPGGPDAKRRLVTIDLTNLTLGEANIDLPANWTSIRLTPNGKDLIWTDRDEPGVVFIAPLGSIGKRPLAKATDVTQIAW